MEVEALNVDRNGGKKHVGLGKIVLKQAVAEFNSAVLFTIPLKHNQKLEKGTVAMNGKLTVVMEGPADAKPEVAGAASVKRDDKSVPRAGAASPTTAAASPADGKATTDKPNDAKLSAGAAAGPPADVKPIAINLRIDQMKAMELYNTGHILDKQDPAIVMKVGRLEFNTER